MKNQTSFFIDIVNEIKQSSELVIMEKYFKSSHNKLIDEIITICKIPAPTFHEEKRTNYLQKKISSLGLEVEVDKHKNVITRYPGKERIAKIVFCAHIDTVFKKEITLKVDKSDDKLSAPGIGDNSASVASMLFIIKSWLKASYVPPFDVIFVGDACEEGLGDLKGITGFLDEYCKHDDIDLKCVIALDGTYENITNVGVGSKRWKINFRAKGGHSWANFGNPSAIHTMGIVIAEISKLKVTKEPKTTYNVGIIEGGTSINTIAEKSSMLIDMRSVGSNELKNLEKRVRSIINNYSKDNLTRYDIEIVGNRPAGQLTDDHPIIKLTQASAKVYNLSDLKLTASSTDSNIPLSRNIPSITFGCYYGKGAHRETEFIVPSSLKKGVPFVNLALISIISWINEN
ncbi:MAG: M20/M25/M40 family metallo-hydrolase [Candidatus Hodarchaeales archaeon]|jgi:acetylornithine deacetylase/succinyl-diaminopimelate desuccinylase-like protein